MGDEREAARNVYEQHRWAEAYELFAAENAVAPLAIADLDRLATAAYMTGDDESAFELWGSAHRECESDGRLEWAVQCGVRTAQGLIFKGEIARARGWVNRTTDLLEDTQIASVENGYLQHVTALLQIFESGDVEGACRLFVSAADIGRTHRNRELLTLGQIGEGRCRIYMGDVAAGVALLDEAMIAVDAGELSPLVVGDSYCTAIDACTELFDVSRSRAWTKSFTRWCDAQSGLVLFQGHCLLHNAELMQLAGQWPEGVAEAKRACELLSIPLNPSALGGAHYVRAELHRLSGDLTAAEDAYRRANEYGDEPQPGLALLRMAQGRQGDADAAIRRALGGAGDTISRARLLAAFIEIVLDAGDVEAAGSAAHELDSIAEELNSVFLRAQAAFGTGSVVLATGDGPAALQSLRIARSAWADLQAPYEGARTRLLGAEACRLVGDHDTADMDLQAARETLERLHRRSPIGETGGAEPQPTDLTHRQVEVLRLVAAGKTNRSIAEELFISEKTVASHISGIFTRLGVSSRAAATAYAYENGIMR